MTCFRVPFDIRPSLRPHILVPLVCTVISLTLYWVLYQSFDWLHLRKFTLDAAVLLLHAAFPISTLVPDDHDLTLSFDDARFSFTPDCTYVDVILILIPWTLVHSDTTLRRALRLLLLLSSVLLANQARIFLSLSLYRCGLPWLYCHDIPDRILYYGTISLIIAHALLRLYPPNRTVTAISLLSSLRAWFLSPSHTNPLLLRNCPSPACKVSQTPQSRPRLKRIHFLLACMMILCTTLASCLLLNEHHVVIVTHLQTAIDRCRKERQIIALSDLEHLVPPLTGHSMNASKTYINVSDRILQRPALRRWKPGRTLSESQSSQLALALAANAAVLRDLTVASLSSNCQFPKAHDWFLARNASLADAVAIRDILGADMCLHAWRRDAERFMNTAHCLLRVIKQYRSTPDFNMSWNIRALLASFAALQSGFSRCEVTLRDIEQLQAGLDNLELTSLFDYATQVWRVQRIAQLERLFVSVAQSRFPVNIKRIGSLLHTRRVLQLYDASLEVQYLSRNGLLDCSNSVIWATSPSRLYSRVVEPTIATWRMQDERRMARYRLFRFCELVMDVQVARIACSLERWHIQHGSYPPRLDNIAAELASADPLVRAVSEWFSYAVTADGYQLSGIGAVAESAPYSPRLDFAVSKE